MFPPYTNLSNKMDGVGLTSHHSLMESFSKSEDGAMAYTTVYMNGIDAYQRFAMCADIIFCGKVLDLACGTEIAGLMALTKLGTVDDGRWHNVYFMDFGTRMIDIAAK